MLLEVHPCKAIVDTPTPPPPLKFEHVGQIYRNFFVGYERKIPVAESGLPMSGKNTNF